MTKSQTLLPRSTPTNQPSVTDDLFNARFQQILREAATTLADRLGREQAINDQASSGEFAALMTLRRKSGP